MRVDNGFHHGVFGSHAPGEDMELMLISSMMQAESKLEVDFAEYGEHVVMKGLTSQPLNPDMVHEARREELE